MPTYELALVIKRLPMPDLKAALKRVGGYIFAEEGAIRKMEYLGFNETGFKIRDKGIRHKEAHVFVFEFEGKVSSVQTIREDISRDYDVLRKEVIPLGDIIRKNFVKPIPYECNIYLDTLPPSERPIVKKMMQKTAVRTGKTQFLHNELPFKPF